MSLVTAGYLFGNMPWVQTHMSTIIWLMIIVPGLLAFIGAWRTKNRGRQAGGAAATRA